MMRSISFCVRQSRPSSRLATSRATMIRTISFRQDVEQRGGEFLSLMRKSLASGADSLKGSIMELMAKRMSEQDMHTLAKHWGRRLSEPSDDSGDLAKSAPINEDSATAESESVQQISTTSKEKVKRESSRNGQIDLLHPYLGELVVDLGYKLVYRSSVKALATASVWKKQRILRPERAALIAQTKIRNKLPSSLPGTIVFFKDESTGAVGIVDGQHRAAALLSLAQKGAVAYLLGIIFSHSGYSH